MRILQLVCQESLDYLECFLDLSIRALIINRIQVYVGVVRQWDAFSGEVKLMYRMMG